MRKIFALLLAIVLCVTAFAFAESTPSKTVEDLVKIAVTGEGLSDGAIIAEDPDEEAVEACNVEIAKLAQAEDAVTYFGQPEALNEIFGEDRQLVVNEFVPIYSAGFEGIAEDSTVVATFRFPTLYPQEMKIAVMIGFVKTDDEGNEFIEWIAFEGFVNEDGSVSVELDGEMVLALEGGAFMAIVSEVEEA